MEVNIEINENDLKDLIATKLENMLNIPMIDTKNIHIMVKSKQNYKSEWEIANFKAIYKLIK